MSAPNVKQGDIVIVNVPQALNNGITTAPLLVTSLNENGTVNGRVFYDRGTDSQKTNQTPLY